MPCVKANNIELQGRRYFQLDRITVITVAIRPVCALAVLMSAVGR